MIMGSAGPVKCRINPWFAILGLSSGGWTRGRAEPGARAERGRAGARPPEDADGGDAGGKGWARRIRRSGWVADGCPGGSGWRAGCGRGGGEALLQGLDEPGVGRGEAAGVGEGAGDGERLRPVAGGLGGAVGHPLEQVGELPVRDDQVALPLGVAGVGGGELGRRCSCSAVKAWRAPGRSPWARRTSPSLSQLTGEVALPLGVAGVGGGELGDDVARLLGGGLGGFEVALGRGRWWRTRSARRERVRRSSGGASSPGARSARRVSARSRIRRMVSVGDAGDRAQALGEVEDQAVGGARRRA